MILISLWRIWKTVATRLPSPCKKRNQLNRLPRSKSLTQMRDQGPCKQGYNERRRLVAVNAFQSSLEGLHYPMERLIHHSSRLAANSCDAPVATRESYDSVTMSSGPTTSTTSSCATSTLRSKDFARVSSPRLATLATPASASSSQSMRRVNVSTNCHTCDGIAEDTEEKLSSTITKI